MPEELAGWLRREREERGLTRSETARLLIQAGKAKGDNMPGVDSMLHNIYRWERGTDAPSERYKLGYCQIFSIAASQFGRRATAASPAVNSPAVYPGQADLPVLPQADIAYRGMEEPDLGRFHVEREVLMAAHEGSDRAEEFEQHGIGETTFEQLRADVMRLSRLCDAGPPLTAFLDMRRVRQRIYRLLDRRLWPGEQTDLHFLLGCINGLMGVTAHRLGYADAAEELIRAGQVSALAIDHQRLLGLLRTQLSANAYWRGWFRESYDSAADGARYLSTGPLAANVHLNYARAAARLGDPDAARRAVELAHAARDSDYSDDLTELGGEEFALSRATHHCMAAHTFIAVGNSDEDAATELGRAIDLYDQGPEAGERHWFGGKALASADLALVRLRSGALDGAVTALEPVLILPPALRDSSLTVRLARVRRELTAPLFGGSPHARTLGDQIEEFSQEAVAAGLHSLSGSPA